MWLLKPLPKLEHFARVPLLVLEFLELHDLLGVINPVRQRVNLTASEVSLGLSFSEEAESRDFVLVFDPVIKREELAFWTILLNERLKGFDFLLRLLPLAELVVLSFLPVLLSELC